jgi:hypothetical protein
VTELTGSLPAPAALLGGLNQLYLHLVSLLSVECQGDRILIPCNDVDRRLESDLITGS